MAYDLRAEVEKTRKIASNIQKNDWSQFVLHIEEKLTLILTEYDSEHKLAMERAVNFNRSIDMLREILKKTKINIK